MAENEIDRRDAIIQMKGGSCVSRKVKQSQMDDLMFFAFVGFHLREPFQWQP